MTNIYLVRHGETDWNKTGTLQGQQQVELNAAGREQARMTGQFLAGIDAPFDFLFSSPLLRARESADIMNEALQLPVKTIDAFAERAFGKAEGLLPEERDLQFPGGEYPGQEKQHVFRDRVLHGFEQLAADCRDKHVILVSHGLVIHMILNHLQNKAINYRHTTLLNGSISHITFDGAAWQVIHMNDISHLN